MASKNVILLCMGIRFICVILDEKNYDLARILDFFQIELEFKDDELFQYEGDEYGELERYKNTKQSLIEFIKSQNYTIDGAIDFVNFLLNYNDSNEQIFIYRQKPKDGVCLFDTEYY